MTKPHISPYEASSGAAQVVLGIRVNPMTKAAAVERLLRYVESSTPGYVCFAEAHMIMESQHDAKFRDIVNGSLMTTSDGTPVRWMVQLLGSREAETVDGPTLTPLVLGACADRGVRVGFYGSSQETLDQMILRIRANYPGLDIAYACSPPFRPLTLNEADEVVRNIASSGVQVLFVGLGCPKQERWMSEHSQHLPCLLLGVGAVFDFLAGSRKMAPAAIQQAGLTWLYRIAQEPRRLAKRVLCDLPHFMALASGQLLRQRLARMSLRTEEDSTL